MSKKYPLIPKGEAMALNLTKEYELGYNNPNGTNPYDFFNDYVEHYAYDIGQQAGRRKDM